MPYYIFQVKKSPVIKKLTLLETCEKYRDARDYCRAKRDELKVETPEEIKMYLAASQLEAEEKLQEKRDKPILMEWEK